MFRHLLPLLQQATLALLICSELTEARGLFTKRRLDTLRNQTMEMFDHGWRGYMSYGFPEDEVRPISCAPLIKDENDLQMNDVLGGYALTMIDTLDMFAITNRTSEFHEYIEYIRDYISFEVDSTVQVFETTIRVVGGLLSSHLYASVPRHGQTMNGYNGELLELAYDLGERLLPAFDTATGIPHARVNLLAGIVEINGEYITENCASGAGSLLLEFGLLSKLSGDQRFEFAARRAFLELWARRSSLDLVAMSIDSESGQWLSPLTGVGASVDSLYEYAMKYYVLFGDEQFFSMFDRMHKSLQKNGYDGWVFNNINFNNGNTATSWIDSLGAFFPGLLVLAGDIDEAARMHLAYYNLWNTYAGIPERWSGAADSRKLPRDKNRASVLAKADPIDLEWWPLRPEFIESTYFLYQATKDPFYLQVGARVLQDINENCRVRCGYAGIHDVRTGKLADRMETFFLSETTKYMYLLFSPEHALNREFSNFVFSTEAHPLWYDEEVVKHASVLRFTGLGERIAANSETSVVSTYQKDNSIFSRLWRAWDGTIKRKMSKAQRRKLKLASSSSSNQSQKKTTENTTNAYPMCQAWPKTTSMHSFIASWEHFYALNTIYNYTQPGWIRNKSPKRTRFELDEQFYGYFIDPQATCRSPDDSWLELAIPLDAQQLQPSRLTVTKSKIKAANLGGIELRLRKHQSDLGERSYKITHLDKVRVEDRTIEIDMLTPEQEALLNYLGKGKIGVNETPISNARILTRQ